MAEGMASGRHHYVPQFYLRRFADQKSQILAYQRSSGRTIRTSVGNAAVETGFYEITDSEGSNSEVVEEILSGIESQTAPAIAALTENWPPTLETKGLVANFVALQSVRTRESRHSIVEMGKAQASVFGEILDRGGFDGMYVGEDFVPRALLGEVFAPDQTQQIETMLQTASEFVESIARRSWSLWRTTKRVFVTSDVPVQSVNYTNAVRPAGMLNADVLMLPLDPRHLLLMDAGPPIDLPAVLEIPRGAAQIISDGVAQMSYEWVYSDPRSKTFDRIAMPVGPRPLGSVSSRGDIYGPGITQD